MWDLIVFIPDHCLPFYVNILAAKLENLIFHTQFAWFEEYLLGARYLIQFYVPYPKVYICSSSFQYNKK